MLKEINRIYHFLNKHPLSQNRKLIVFQKFLAWQIQSRINASLQIRNWIPPLKLLLKKGLTGATGNYYVGLHDFEEMTFMLHLLENKSIFCDIGANIGTYSLLASGLKKAKSFCFEPIPSTFDILQKNITINNLENLILPYNMGLGEKKNTLVFSENLNTVNHVLQSKNEQGIEIPVKSLDSVLLEIPDVIKIDVEGFEYFVLRGAKKILSNSKLKAIIIELNGSGGRYGITDKQVHEFLTEYKFIPVKYAPFTRELQKLDSFRKNGNTIYVRDFEDVQEKLIVAEELVIHGRRF